MLDVLNVWSNPQLTPRCQYVYAANNCAWNVSILTGDIQIYSRSVFAKKALHNQAHVAGTLITLPYHAIYT